MVCISKNNGAIIMKKWIIAFMVTLYVPNLLLIFIPAIDLTVIEPSNSSLIVKGMAVLFIADIVLSIVLAGANIVKAVTIHKRITPGEKESHNIGTLVIMKFVLLPFYVIHFLFWISAAFLASTPFTLPLWIIVPFGFMYGFMVMLVSAVLGISQMIFFGRESILTKKQTAIHSIWQLIPFVDAISCLNIYLKTKKQLGAARP